MSKKSETDSGYILLEALIALGVMAVACLLIWPLIVNNVAREERAEQELGLYRAYYEASKTWQQPAFTAEWSDEQQSYRASQSPSSLRVQSDAGDMLELSLISAEVVWEAAAEVEEETEDSGQGKDVERDAEKESDSPAELSPIGDGGVTAAELED